jgi:hypothetical protein
MPCESRVRIWSNEKGVEVAFKHFCSGECNDKEKPCKSASYQTDTLIVETCYCDGGEGDKGGEVGGCHIVLCTSKDGTKFTRCDGTCDHRDKDECRRVPVGAPHKVPIPTKDEKYDGTRLGSYTDYRCECKPKKESK